MKKVLFLTHTLQAGGAEKILINLVKNMDKTKFDITVATIVNDGIYVEDIKKISGVKYIYIFDAFFKKQRANKEAKYSAFFEKCMRAIWKAYLFLLKYFPARIIYKARIKEKYDVEIAFLEGKPAKLIAASPNKKSKKIAWIHTDIINFKNAYKYFKNEKEEIETYKKFNEIICVSKRC